MSVLLALALAALDPPAPGQATAARAAFLAERTAALSWMTGGWDVELVADGAPRNQQRFSYIEYALQAGWIQIRDSNEGFPYRLTFIGFDPVARDWMSVSIDTDNNVVRLRAPGWRQGRAVFEGDAQLLGRPAHLRRTIAREDTRNFSITEEERVDGAWRVRAIWRYGTRPVN